jgi:hypothetical protein
MLEYRQFGFGCGREEARLKVDEASPSRDRL